MGFVACVGVSIWLLSPGDARSAPASQPDCATVLGKRLDVFMESYPRETKTMSELGYDEAAELWADCREKKTREELASQPKVLDWLMDLRRQELEYVGLSYALAKQISGGGTMYQHRQRRFRAKVEQHIAALGQLQLSKQRRIARAEVKKRQARVDDLDSQIRKTLQSLDNGTPATDAQTKSESRQTKKDFTRDRDRLRDLFDAMQKALRDDKKLKSLKPPTILITEAAVYELLVASMAALLDS